MRSLMVVIGLALISLEVNAPLHARTPYDGLWSVSLKVDQGSCSDREIEVFIRNGEISHAGERGFFTAEGRVGERGRVEVSIGALGMWLVPMDSCQTGKVVGSGNFPTGGAPGSGWRAAVPNWLCTNRRLASLRRLNHLSHRWHAPDISGW